VIPERVRRNATLVALLAFATALFLYEWAFDNNRPHGGSLGWHAFHDQGYYYREAAALAHLDAIPAKEFFYGPAYPALAAPFSRIGSLGWPSGDPFFVADLAVFLLTVAATYFVGRRLLGEWFGIACAFALMLATPLVDYVATPWNSTASLAALVLTLLVSLAHRLRWWHGAVLGLAVALAYGARYVDAAWILIAAVTILYARRALSWRSPALLAAATSGYLALLPTFYLHWEAFGDPFTASYRRLSGNPVTGSEFELGNVLPHALSVLVSPFYFDENGFRSVTAQPLLDVMFLTLLAPLGYALVVAAARGPRRTLALGYGLASALSVLFYLAYYFTGSFGVQNGALHYFKLWWPLWTIAAVAGVYGGVERLRSWSSSAREGSSFDRALRNGQSDRVERVEPAHGHGLGGRVDGERENTGTASLRDDD
jgi:hypothetical protein